MPKIKVKSHSGAKKRFKQTASGKFKYQKTYKRHLLTGRSTKRKRHLRQAGIVGHSHHHQVVAMLPYGTP
jgi:large subunit ribosomal protein L35